MLEVYVDYVSCKQDKKGAKATIHFSTERGEKGEVNVSESGVNKIELMTKYLAEYSSGLYSKADGKFIALSDYSDDLEGYEPYHLNYCPEYIEREFRHGDENISGYTFGPRNPLYGDKIKCTWSDVNYTMESDGTCFVTVGIYDDFGSFVDVYSGIVVGTDPNQCVLDAIKELAGNYHYCLEEGGWDIFTGIDDPTGTCYSIDLDYDTDEILALTFHDNEF